MSLQERVDNLRKEIDKHEYNFFILGQQSISEFEMESLRLELELLEKKLEKITPQDQEEFEWFF